MEVELLIRRRDEDPSITARRMAWIDWLRTHTDMHNTDSFRVVFIHNMGGHDWQALVEGPASNVKWMVSYLSDRTATCTRLVEKASNTYAIRNDDENMAPHIREKNIAYNDMNTPEKENKNV